MKVKIFGNANTLGELERNINTWLNSNDRKIINIQPFATIDGLDCNAYSALILYHKDKTR